MIQEILTAIKVGVPLNELGGRVDTMVDNFISQPKAVTDRYPSRGNELRENSRSRSVTLELSGIENNRFSVFIREHIDLDHNYSIGLDHLPDEGILRKLPIVRYNSQHDPKQRTGHRPSPHIHRITINDIIIALKNEIKIKIRSANNTEKYTSFEELLAVFPSDTNIIDFSSHVKKVDFLPTPLQERLF